MNMYRLIYVFIFMVCIYQKTSASESTIYESYYGFNYQLFDYADAFKLAESDVVAGSYAHLLGAYLSMPIGSRFHLNTGLDLVYLPDNLAFYEAVEDSRGDDDAIKKSQLVGLSWYIEAGPKFRVYYSRALRWGVTVGYRQSDVQRTIVRCSGCRSDKFNNFDSTFYLRPYMDYHFSNRLFGQFYFSNYFGKSDFERGVGIQLSLKLF